MHDLFETGGSKTGAILADRDMTDKLKHTFLLLLAIDNGRLRAVEVPVQWCRRTGGCLLPEDSWPTDEPQQSGGKNDS